MKKQSLLVVAMLICLMPAWAWAQSDATEAASSKKELKAEAKAKKSFGQKLLTPFKWIGKNWSAYDPQYSVPEFYNWVFQLQNTTSCEWMNIRGDGINVKMRSQMCNKIGPHLGYSFLFYGYTVDINTIGKPKKKKNEFTLSINSNLVNLDLIRRRTGGDFSIQRMDFRDPNERNDGTVDMKDFAEEYGVDDVIKNAITGFNLNIFTNHKKYSNPAAFSNGAIQLRSAGSPMLGFGYTYQKTTSDLSAIVGSYAFDNVGLMMSDFPEELINSIPDVDAPDEAWKDFIVDVLDYSWPNLKNDTQLARQTRALLTSRFPSTTTIKDWHLQLGYAYNLVFSRRLLLGLSAVLSPGIKRVHYDNEESLSYLLADDLCRIIQKHEGVQIDPDYFRYSYNGTHFNINLFARASLTYNFNRWRAGLNASFNRFYYDHDGTRIDNLYGNLTAYVGYCFGRKKMYRHDGERRQDYIMAALTPSQIEEMHDTLPEGNVHKGRSYLSVEGKTRRYHTDEFNLRIFGCDLVKGPDGRYGWYEVQDGFVTPGQDTDGRLSKGGILEVDQDGTFTCESGHRGSFRAGNWWKSQLSIDKIPNHWYPEMLHYALRGKLTLWLRGRIFGTRKPVKVELEDFCINHGRETTDFFQMGIKSFRSNSTYSIEGRANINGHECRVYIEQKNSGKKTNVYFSRVYESYSKWMGLLSNDCPVSNISMPGTHDSGTASLPESPIFKAGHTQNFSMTDQLYDGIRAFDIRLKKSLKYGHTMTCRESFDSTMVEWDRFLTEHPTEFIVAMVGSDEGGKWDTELIENYSALIARYPHRFVQDFDASTKLGDVRGKILVIRRQEECPFGKLLKFTDNAVFDYGCFRVEDVYKQHKTWKKIKLVEQNIREAYENEDPGKWYITFNSIAWDPRHHAPYSYAWGEAKNIRRPMNPSLREFIELKDYSSFGIVFLDFYNAHGDVPQVVETIIKSNFNLSDE